MLMVITGSFQMESATVLLSLTLLPVDWIQLFLIEITMQLKNAEIVVNVRKRKAIRMGVDTTGSTFSISMTFDFSIVWFKGLSLHTQPD